ncbi:hypothetical protein M2271_002147 [Streptomyces sp. LBL]|uniref:hypothetical protein n=1 Tax=Streptomyces sp. LBL TaxID=2940562 RepID=UPI00247452F6|nr:hypothetical protein [Streptomyces sp. LBL]MDH6624345.1 hypothetical protein [Streptomyces sp. LBL]
MAWLRRKKRVNAGMGEPAQQVAARAAQLALADLAPLVWAYSDREYGLELIVGEAVEHSGEVYQVVEDLFTALGPEHPLHTAAIAAGEAAAGLSLLRESWVGFCAQHAPPGRDEPTAATDRVWPNPSVLSAWPRYEVACARTRRALVALTELKAQLTQYTGHDVPAAWCAA